MMKLFLLMMAFMVSVAHAGVIPLPRGGKLTLKSQEWNVQETKGITGVDSLLFAHRKVKDLHGIVLDGTPKDKGECAPGKSEICERVVPMGNKTSYQIIAQKYVGQNTYQNYVIAFTLEKSQQDKHLPELKKLKASLEFAK